jgi:beta-carotene 3-hydroxylase
MEWVARETHRHVMHGALWNLHEDHHRPSGRGLQKNDSFVGFFGSISIILIALGVIRRWSRVVAAGIGMALYGLGYFVFHDVMFHRRIPSIRYRPQTPYMKRIFRAHSVHHKHNRKENATSFGFLYAGPEYAEE